MSRHSFFALLVFFVPGLLLAQEKPAAKPTARAAAKNPPARPKPTVANYAYGTDSERQKFDFWQAKSDKPTPVVLLIHGGGWKGGDKTGYGAAAIQPYLDAGISVAAINYRFIPQAMEQKVEPPVKGCLYDAARALQTIRSKAKEWNLDPRRVGATGTSAGACTSLWLALHDDLADPTHSAVYGVKLVEKLEAAGIESVLSYPGHKDDKYGSIAKFLITKLTSSESR